MKRIIKVLRKKGCKNIGVVTYKRNYFERLFNFLPYFQRADEGHIQKFDDTKVSWFTTKKFNLDTKLPSRWVKL